MKMFIIQSYSEILAYRLSLLSKKLWQPTFNFLILGLFLFGVYFGKKKLINEAGKNRETFIKLIAIGFFIGMVFNVLFIWAMIKMPPEVGTFWRFAINLGTSGSGICFTLVYVAMISLLMLGNAKRFLYWFAPVRRMALTHYLLQSLIGTWILYGYGFGLMTEFNYKLQLIFVICMFTAQMLLSYWWLARYRFGPVEWLWRSLTYRQLLPFRIEKKEMAFVS
ncbi:DUF418 domain-containing protein [Aliikangiella maris]|uniref:DUF418 domain-containing protein n=2 Tax=Aliikangiella maris TaxID=3162458 RepID=A0ABV3MUI8_9GAMM